MAPSPLSKEEKDRKDQEKLKYFQKLALEESDHKTMKKLNSYSGSCSNCGAHRLIEGVKLSACTGCNAEEYCSKECQKEHWESHKVHCEHQRKLTGFKDELSMEAPQVTAAFEHLQPFTQLITGELESAMMYAMRVGYENPLHLTHSAYFIFNYNPSETELRKKFTFVRAGIETIEEGCRRIFEATPRAMRNMEQIRASFTQKYLLEGSEKGILRPNPHAFVCTAQVLGVHKHGNYTRQGLIAHYSGPMVLSTSERIVLVQPPRNNTSDQAWEMILRASLARAQPRSKVDSEIIFGSIVMGGVDAFWEYYSDVRAEQASTGVCEPHLTLKSRAEQKRSVQGLLPHDRAEVDAMTVWMDAEKKKVANAKKKARKQRALDMEEYKAGLRPSCCLTCVPGTPWM